MAIPDVSDKPGRSERSPLASWLGVPALALMAFVVAEFISGATVIGHAGRALPTLVLYGAGVVFIRELSRRSPAGLVCAALLGVAYAFVEEGEALGTMFSPTLLGAAARGGRAFGVNWIWSIWIIGFHVVVSIMVPITAVELLFRRARPVPWTNRVGLVIAGVLWLAAAAMIAHFFRAHMPAAAAPPTALLAVAGALALAVAVVAVTIGRGDPEGPRAVKEARAPAPIWVGAAVLVMAGAWVWTAHLPASLKAYPMAFVPLVVELILAVLAVRQFLRWPRTTGWTDTHTAFALLAVIVVETAQGARYVAAMAPADRLGQLAAGLVAAAVVLLGLLNCRRAAAPAARNLQGVS